MAVLRLLLGQEQLGLRLVAERGRVEVLAIDSVTRPSEKLISQNLTGRGRSVRLLEAFVVYSPPLQRKDTAAFGGDGWFSGSA